MLLDTEAHVLVLPKRLLAETITLSLEDHAKRHVKVFVGDEIALDGWTNQFEYHNLSGTYRTSIFMWMLKYLQLVGMICCEQRISLSIHSQPRSGQIP